ncbi:MULTISPECIES: endolytic transglycosylase MltG [Streptomyces]|uniref:Endolytic murein transglycosylase n=1 Tax=Streptomyces eurythermus TaxID=42237 RepID=A0ABW6YYM3_9ACTN|nr:MULTISPECIES: endolytic transglycosylase MltG [Streptomyces]
MQTNTPPRNTLRLTRRGRLVTLVAGAVAAGTAVAVPLLLLAGDRDEARSASLVIPEGWRASQVYDAVDKALRLPPGSTRKSLGKAALKLPGEAQGNPEGYLFPATYPIPEGATPESLLRTMVDTANDKYGLAPVTAGAQRNAMNLHQAVTVASIVQAEADTKADMGKIARVILNRLARGMPLQMDSTVSYALEHDPAQAGQSSGQVQSPYNSYQRMGLPPTPIDNPGAEAMRAALNPTPGDWLYFVTVRPGETRFTADYDEHLRNVAEFHAVHQSAAPAQPDGGVPWSSSSPVPAQPSGG